MSRSRRNERACIWSAREPNSASAELVVHSWPHYIPSAVLWLVAEPLPRPAWSPSHTLSFLSVKYSKFSEQVLSQSLRFEETALERVLLRAFYTLGIVFYPPQRGSLRWGFSVWPVIKDDDRKDKAINDANSLDTWRKRAAMNWEGTLNMWEGEKAVYEQGSISPRVTVLLWRIMMSSWTFPRYGATGLKPGGRMNGNGNGNGNGKRQGRHVETRNRKLKEGRRTRRISRWKGNYLTLHPRSSCDRFFCVLLYSFSGFKIWTELSFAKAIAFIDIKRIGEEEATSTIFAGHRHSLPDCTFHWWLNKTIGILWGASLDLFATSLPHSICLAESSDCWGMISDPEAEQSLHGRAIRNQKKEIGIRSGALLSHHVGCPKCGPQP